MIDQTPERHAPEAALAVLSATRLAVLAAELVSEGDVGDLIYEPLREDTLGAGLSRQWGMYVYREALNAPVCDMGLVEGYALDLGEGRRIALEIDAGADVAAEVNRRIHLTWPGQDVVDVSFRAAELHQLGQLLARPEVAEALARWAAEDAAGDARAGEGGQK